MSTGLTIINSAYDDLEIKSAEVALTASELQTGIERYNRLIAQLASRGFDVSANKISNVMDETNLPDWFEDVVVTHLAIRLAGGFGAQVPPSLAAAADLSITYAYAHLFRMGEVVFPPTLPVGSGNFQRDNTRFFNNTSQGDFLDDGGDTFSDGQGNTISDTSNPGDLP